MMDSEVTSIEMKPASQGVTNLAYRSTEVRTAYQFNLFFFCM